MKLDSTQISEILESYVENSKSIETAIITLAKSIDTINKKVDMKAFKKGHANTKTILAGINEYMSDLSEIISELQNPKNGVKFDADFAKTMMGFDANLEKALEAASTEQEKAPIQTAINLNKKSSIPQQILAFVGVLGNIFSAFIKIGDSFNNPIAIIKLKVAMIVLKKNLKELVTTIVDTFSSIDMSELKDVMNVLVSDPEVVTNTLINHTKNSIEKDAKNSTDAFSKNISVTQKGKQGLIDVITNVLNIFQLLNSLAFPNLLVFRVKMNLSMKQLNIMWKELGKFISSNKFDESKIDAMNKSFEGLIETYMSIKNIVETVNKIGGLGNLKDVYLAEKVVGLIFNPNPKAKTKSIFVILTKAINAKSFETFASEDTTKKLQQFQKNIKIISNVATNLALIGLLTAPLLLAYVGVLLLKGLVWLIFKLFDKDTIDAMNEAQEGIVKLSLVIVALSASVILLALTGLLIVESWTVMGMVMLYLVAVTAMFFVISLIVKFMDEIDVTQSILYIAATIGILALTVILLSLAGKLITEEWDNILKVALYLGVLVVTFLLLSIATKWIKEGGKSILYLALAVGILVVIMYILVPVSYLVNDNWDNIQQTLLMLGALVLAVIGVAFASKLIKKGVAPMIMIAIAMIVMSASLLIIAKAAESITWKSFGIFSLIVGGLTAIAIGLGNPAVALIALTGAGVLIAIGAAFLIFAISLKTTIDAIKTAKEMNLDPKKDSNLIKQPIEIICKAIEYASTISIKTVMSGVAKIMLIGEASSAISNMGDTVQKFAELKMPTKFDKNGKPIAFKPMSKTDFENAATNIKTIITFILEAISSKEITETLEILSEQAIENIGLIMDNTAGVVNLIDAIEKAVQLDDTKITNGVASIKSAISKYIIALQELFVGTGNIKKGLFGGYHLEITGAPELDEDQLDEIKDNLENVSAIVDFTVPMVEHINEMADKSKDSNPSVISDIISKYINAIYGDENGKGGIKIGGNVPKQNGQLSFIISQQERLAKINTGAIQKNTDNFIRFIDKANSVDVEKIKSIRDMFEQISGFSKSVKGDFDKLADVLSEKLVVILEKLHGTLEGISTSETSKEYGAAGTTAVEEKRTPAEANKAKDDKQKQQEKNIKDIKDALDEITLVLKGVKDNTDNYYRGGFGGF